MGDIVFDPNDLLRQFDTVSRHQRAVVAECERLQSRLIQVLRWYDHQRLARGLELRRQSERVDKETRQQINTRSKMVVKERARLKHLLDEDDDIDRTDLFSFNASKSFYHVKDSSDNRKRKVYGCSLPQFKARLTKSSENWSQYRFNSTLSQFDYKKPIEKERSSINKFIQSPIEQRNRMNTIINKCLHQFEQCEGNGYDHFLQTSDPNQNAQILAQQILNDTNKKNYR